MSLVKLLKLAGVCMAVMMVGSLNSSDSTLVINFHRTPPARSQFTTAVFGYSVKRQDGSNACMNHSCSMHCELDGQSLSSCPAGTILLKNLTVNQQHKFLLNVITHDGERNSSAYSWFVDTVPPTATISSKENYTNAERITIVITFSEACPGKGGFKCANSSNCDVFINGPGHVQASSLRIIKPNIIYSLPIILSKRLYGRVVIGMVDSFCTDLAGNQFRRTNGSIIVIHFDRRPVLVDLWTSVPSYELEINGVPRTVLATNKLEKLEMFLDFSIPIMNSTEQILKVLHVNSRSLIPVHNGSLGNRRFVFKLKNTLETEIITVELQAELLIGITGTPVSPVASLTFLYDSTRPGVGLSTSSPRATKDPNINVIVEFTKPVFGFEASMIEVYGGRVTRQELSRALYSFNVLAVTQNVVSITVPATEVNDVSGNLNLASNLLQVQHYITPAISTALHSFVTAGILATSLAASILSLSSASLGAVSTLYSGRANIVASDPSMNLHGLVGHLQVFVLSDWFLVNQPVEYSETTKGLRWLIPRQKLPWKKDSTSIWPNHVYLAEDKFTRKFSNLSVRFPFHDRAFNQIALTLTNSSYEKHRLPPPTEIDPKYGGLHGQHNTSMKNTPYAWQDLEINMFWLGVGGGSLLMIHLLTLLFLRWRTETPALGILSVPRFELLLMILMLPCISQSSAFVIRGGTTEGIIVGALLLAIPAAFILSVSLFLMLAIFPGSFAQYKEIRQLAVEKSWYMKLWFFLPGRPAAGKWFYREGLPSSFLPRFGILFENQKGPPLFVFVDQNDPHIMPTWTESGQSGIGRMRAVSVDESNEDIKIPMSRRVLGCAQSSYIILDLLRRVILGVISGAYSSHHLSQRLFALAITVIQLMYLIAMKPYISTGVHVVETVSLLCEAWLKVCCKGSCVAFPPKKTLVKSHTRYLPTQNRTSSSSSFKPRNNV
ncbi:hypothetical protein CFOL_v3_07789 [Cephalotus follicularis]|uniref:Bacterial Ig-like domain-containing protein n=1 Tax=Cephalotus follicularis TaxID=3775 RepID=A0A1Q3B8A0_CEPFO|nr:hypothetical protein CFOL_v3_07789 [Cephalotus follicularis]